MSRRRAAVIASPSNTVIRSNFGLTALSIASALGLPSNTEPQPARYGKVDLES